MPPFPLIVSPTLAVPVTAAQGGTGIVSPTAHGVAVAEGAGNFAFIVSTANYALVGASGADPAFQQSLDSIVLVNPLAVGSGGTGLASVPANNLLIGSGGGGLRAVATLNPAQGGSGASSLTDHALIVAHGSSAFSALVSTTGTLSYPAVGQGPASDPTFSNTVGSLVLNTPLAVNSGGIGISSVPANNLLVGSGGGSLRAIATVTVPLGGTGVSSLTANGVLVGQGSSAIAVTSAGTFGQVFTSNGPAAAPTFQAASSGSASAVLFQNASDNGKKVQSGTSTASSNTGSTYGGKQSSIAVTFPATFNSTPIVIPGYQGTFGGCGVTSITTTGCSISGITDNGGSANGAYSYIAIG